MPRKATIGPEIFARVNELVDAGEKRTDAFTLVAQERGSRPGSVAANYYRVARSVSQTKPRRAGARRRRATATTTPRRARTTPAQQSTSTSGDIGQIAQQIADLTQQLVRQVQARDERIRKVLG